MISFFVRGLPKPAGSKRGFALKKGGQYTGRVVITDDCKTSRDWKTDVRNAVAANFIGPPKGGPLSVTLTFFLPRPKHHYRSDGTVRDNAPNYHTIRPDVLKLTRAVEDSLTGVVWMDDSQIVVERLAKMYASNTDKTGVNIIIEPLFNDPFSATPSSPRSQPTLLA